MKIPLRFTLDQSTERLAWIYDHAEHDLSNFNFDHIKTKGKELAQLLSIWDNYADQAAIDIYLNNGLEFGNQALIEYLEAKQSNTKEEKVWQHFFSKIILEPSWLNHDKIKTGAEFCRRAGVSSFIVLRNFCFMGSFQTSSLYKPYFYLGDLKDNIKQKIKESIEFWVQITKEDNLKIGKKGVTEIFKKRMNFSYQRLKLLSETNYPTQIWGIPYNQWDQLAEILNYSLLYLIGLRKIGIHATLEETNCFFHFWKYIGYLLGIPIELLPNSEAEAIDSLNTWILTQPALDADSRTLAQILVNEPLTANHPKDAFSRNLMREIHLYYNRHFLSKELCKELGLPKSTIGRFALAHIWKTKQFEKSIIDECSRHLAIKIGSQEQENIRKLFEEK